MCGFRPQTLITEPPLLQRNLLCYKEEMTCKKNAPKVKLNLKTMNVHNSSFEGKRMGPCPAQPPSVFHQHFLVFLCAKS